LFWGAVNNYFTFFRFFTWGWQKVSLFSVLLHRFFPVRPVLSPVLPLPSASKLTGVVRSYFCHFTPQGRALCARDRLQYFRVKCHFLPGKMQIFNQKYPYSFQAVRVFAFYW
jgi:hypothetical protein